MRENGIQYQRRTRDWSKRDILAELPNLIDITTLSFEEITVLQNYFALIDATVELFNKQSVVAHEYCQALDETSENGSSGQSVARTRKKLAEVKTAINIASNRLTDFEKQNAQILDKLYEIGRPIIEEQEKERARIRQEQLYQKYPYRNPHRAIKNTKPDTFSQTENLNHQSAPPMQTGTKTQEAKQKRSAKKTSSTIDRQTVIKIVSILLCVILYFVLLTTFFSNEIDTYICYTTNTGECYHAATCQYLRQSRHETTVYQAKRNYRSCSRCNPCVERYEITITDRNYFIPLLISTAVSASLYLLLTYRQRE